MWFFDDFLPISPAITKRLETLKQRPWYDVDVPPNVQSGRGMVHPDERRLLYSLAKDYFTGQGCIIDGGAYLGSSSLAFGLGLRDRGYPQKKVIHAFDLFIIDPNAAALTLDQSDPLSFGIKGGDSVRHIYDRNVAEIAQYLTVHEGDVTKSRWTGGPIEILFCDISKMPSVNDYVLEQWFTRLIPKTGILIQQDQVQEHHVWIAVTMSILSEYFEIIDFVPHSTVVYRLKRRIPKRAIRQALDRNISRAGMEEHYLRSLEMFRELNADHKERWHLGMVELGLPVLYGFHIGDTDKARSALSRIKTEFATEADTMARAAMIDEHLAAKTPCPGSRLYWN